METSAISSNLNLISQSTNPSKAETDKAKLFSDYTQFLTMLTTQLQHQDPTEPLDTNQFTQQLVQFASVEQQVSTNQNIEKMVKLFESQGVDTAVGYIGKMVEAKGDGGFLNNGTAPFVYSLDRPAENVNVVVTDASGRAVFSGKGTGNAGKNLVTWNGKNSFTGLQMPEGTYHMHVQATDFNGEQFEPTTYTTGYVSAVEMVDGVLNLTVGNLQVPVADVLAIRETPEGLSASDTEAADEEDTAAADDKTTAAVEEDTTTATDEATEPTTVN